MSHDENLPRHKKVWSHMKHHFMTLSFLIGFALDNLTLNRIDQPIDQVILAWYVLLAMGSTIALYAAAAHKLPEKILGRTRRWAPYIMQYAFGGLLSGMLIFYGRAGSWDASWPFMLIILVAIFGNEMIHDRTTRLIYNLSILFVGLFSYVVQAIPVFTGWMGPWVFVGSGLLALMIMYGFLRVLLRVIPNFMGLHMKAVIFTIGAVFIGFNFLYFTNIIPPIPLSLKEVGIYHSVVRFGNGDYQVTYEPGPWWRFYEPVSRTIHPAAGENVFCFARIYAPGLLKTEVMHVWEYKNPKTGKWEEHAHLPYPISGGNLSGYRGYTLISNYQSGTWRCSVETTRGQVLGREVFTIDTSTPATELKTRIR